MQELRKDELWAILGGMFTADMLSISCSEVIKYQEWYTDTDIEHEVMSDFIAEARQFFRRGIMKILHFKPLD